MSAQRLEQGGEIDRSRALRCRFDGQEFSGFAGDSVASALLAGGGIRGGQRYGQTDERGEEVVDRKVTVPDFNATIAHALGLDVEKVHQSPTGRPFQVADKGRPIAELFA